MASDGDKKPRLVADKRYPKATTKKATGKGTTAKAEPKLTGSAQSASKSGAPTASGLKAMRRTQAEEAPKARKTKAAKPARATRRKARRPVPKTRFGRFAAFVAAAFGWILGRIWWVSWRAGVLVTVVIGAMVVYEAAKMPPAASRLDARVHGSVTFEDRDGKVFAWRGEHHGSVSIDKVSPWLKDAVIATEDKRFYHELAVSPRGIVGAMLINIRAGRGPFSGNGGSTITQQTAKLLCAGVDYDPNKWKNQRAYQDECRRATLGRKIKEAIYALAMELRYTKDQILTIYFNRVFLGSGTNGFESASQRYFGKSAADLRPAEAAMLAGLLAAPTRYAPTNDLARSQARAATVIRLMEEQGYLTKAQADYAQAHPATLAPSATNQTGDWFADWVMSTAPSFLTTDTTEDVTIKTTYDPSIQKAAEAAVHDVLDKKLKDTSNVEAAVIIMSPDGAVRAVVGGRDTAVAGAFNRATQAMRQTGSAFKPFVYAAAMEAGYSPASTVDDAPLTIDVPGSGPWSPKNYGDVYMGRVNLVTALAHSLNTAAVRVSEAIGREKVRQIAMDFGMPSTLIDTPAVALGASEASLLQVTGSYAGILNDGVAVQPYGVLDLRLKGQANPLMSQEGGPGTRVISDLSDQELVFMMNQVVENGTGRRAQIKGWQVAGKTGTTSSYRDAWFVGFTAEYVCGVWMGYDDNTPMKNVTGGGLPAEIWHDAMAKIHQGIPVRDLNMSYGNTQDVALNDPYAQQDQQQQQQNRAQDNGVLHDLLGAIFGRRN